MERKNFFELLGLPFDPVEPNETRFKAAFRAAAAEWKKRAEETVNNPQSNEQKAAAMAELALLPEIEAVMGEKKSRNAEARELREQRTAQLEQLLDIMMVDETGSPEVTSAQIRSVHLKLGLSIESVEKSYKKKGFTVQEKAKRLNLNEFFLLRTTLANLDQWFDILRSARFEKENDVQYVKRNYPWHSKVTNLYELAFYLKGDSGLTIEDYRKKRTADLCSIMEAQASQFTANLSGYGHVIGDLLHSACAQVFNSEANRRKYDRSLELEKLGSFFSLLKTAPEDFKKDRFFAESCVTTIQKYFPDYDLALALYNQEAGLLGDPYEPVEALIHVTCGGCKAPAQFRTRKEAVAARCSACGAALYTECPSCRNKVPASAERCSCGFLISEMQFFDEYVKLAQFALEEMDLVEARKQLANAKSAYPGHPSLQTLEEQIKAASERYQKPLDELQALMAGGMYERAQEAIAKISASLPKLRLDSQIKEVSAKLAEARRLMPAPSVPDNEAADRCVGILRVVRDFSPAIERLGSIQPKPAKNPTASVKETPKLVCTLTWGASGESGITYKVVRKKGGIPKQYADGEVLAADLNALEYQDSSLSPGVSYGYAVFACRYGVYSEPAGCEVISYSELDPAFFQAAADNGLCRFSWALPSNCVGVRVLRKTGGFPGETPGDGAVVAVEKAQTGFNDSQVQNGVQYCYRLQCIYPYGSGFRYSRGTTVALSPAEPLQALRQVSLKMEGRTAVVHWDGSGRGNQAVTIWELPGGDAQSLVGRALTVADLKATLGSGKVLAMAKAASGICQFVIPANSSVNFAVVVAGDARCMVSAVLQASSIEPCEIDRGASRIENGRLIIRLRQLSQHLERIYYIASVKTDAKPPWATVNDAKRCLLYSLTAAEYRRDGAIVMESVPQEDLYISVIGQFRMPDGGIVYSDVSRMRLSNRPKSQIGYSFSWGSSFFGKPKAKDFVLAVCCHAPETPEIKLVYRTDGHIPMRLQDPKNVVLATIPESDSGFSAYPRDTYTLRLPDSVWAEVGSGANLRLLISDNDLAEFEIRCADVGAAKVPNLP